MAAVSRVCVVCQKTKKVGSFYNKTTCNRCHPRGPNTTAAERRATAHTRHRREHSVTRRSKHAANDLPLKTRLTHPITDEVIE